jgi:hypothetical protein
MTRAPFSKTCSSSKINFVPTCNRNNVRPLKCLLAHRSHPARAEMVVSADIRRAEAEVRDRLRAIRLTRDYLHDYPLSLAAG